MRLKTVGLAIAGLIVGMSGPVQAAVKYVYSSPQGAEFVYIAASYLPNNDGYLQSCKPIRGYSDCNVFLYPNYGGSDFVRVLSFPNPRDFNVPYVPETISEDFALGSFGAPGVYTGSLRGSLTVTDLNPSATPEPATWAMLIFGMAGVGAMIRRTRVALV